jgi:hypothetical protein
VKALWSTRREMLGALPKGGIVAEVGVYSGEWSQDILQICKPAKLHLIDLWPQGKLVSNAGEEELGERLYARVLDRFCHEIETGKVICHRCNSVSVASEFDDYYFDWIYIDADHSYKGVRNDLEYYFWKVRPGGYILGHDYVAVSKTGKRYGVIDAINSFVEEYPVTAVGITNDYHASFMLRVAEPVPDMIERQVNDINPGAFPQVRIVQDDPPRRIANIVTKLCHEGITIKHEAIDDHAYKSWMSEVCYEQRYPAYLERFPGKAALSKKSLEHFLSVKYIRPREEDVIIDVGAHRSPFADILRSLYNVRCVYRQDIYYPAGIHDNLIGSDAAHIPLADDSVDKIVLHCALEHFEGDSDVMFINEAARLLRPNGMLFVIPLWLAEVYFIQTSQQAWVREGIPLFDPFAVISIQSKYSIKFARYLDPVRLKQRLLKTAEQAGLSYDLLHFTNWRMFPRCPLFALAFHWQP